MVKEYKIKLAECVHLPLYRKGSMPSLGHAASEPSQFNERSRSRRAVDIDPADGADSSACRLSLIV